MSTLLIIVFAIGYLTIIAEHPLKINKTAPALLTGILCWVIYIVASQNPENVLEHITEHTGDIAQILLFLMGAMTIVELIDLHDGFDIITRQITAKKATKLLWIITWITFFLSAILDNLTSTIVMCTLLDKLVHNKADRKFFAGMVVIAANSGGAWSPIGDVTTSMLWIGGQITAMNIIIRLIIPSIISLLIPLIYVTYLMKKRPVVPMEKATTGALVPGSKMILFIGLGCLVLVPVFKTVMHLPPFMGMLLGLGILWLLAELIHRGKEEIKNYTAMHALSKIDMPSILFFFGILSAVGALQSAGLLNDLAAALNRHIGNENLIVMTIGAVSAIIDNVPLVAASMGMYPLASELVNHNVYVYAMQHKELIDHGMIVYNNVSYYLADARIWEFLAYAAGTGGSLLIIGSAAGVAAMGLQEIDFMWYLKKISFIALIGYVSGALAYLGIIALLP
jgi:Na+/H+ antiporter NhaD/arsenite permease-like protein